MTNLKTKEEMYFDYNEAIEYLESEVNSLESLIGRTEVEIKHKNDRIEKLKETAEMYAPKQKTEVNIDLAKNPSGMTFAGKLITTIHAHENVRPNNYK